MSMKVLMNCTWKLDTVEESLKRFGFTVAISTMSVSERSSLINSLSWTLIIGMHFVCDSVASVCVSVHKLSLLHKVSLFQFLYFGQTDPLSFLLLPDSMSTPLSPSTSVLFLLLVVKWDSKVIGAVCCSGSTRLAKVHQQASSSLCDRASPHPHNPQHTPSHYEICSHGYDASTGILSHLTPTGCDRALRSVCSILAIHHVLYLHR